MTEQDSLSQLFNSITLNENCLVIISGTPRQMPLAFIKAELNFALNGKPLSATVGFKRKFVRFTN